MARHNELGTKGEDCAAEFLKTLQHEILERNYRHGRAEVDIISKEGKTIVFTEVKTRSTNAFGYPEEFVDKKKRTQMKLVAEEYMYHLKGDACIRFDIISISNEKDGFKVHHIKDAFFHE